MINEPQKNGKNLADAQSRPTDRFGRNLRRNLAEFRFRIRINRAFGYKFAGFCKFIRNLSGFCRRIINLAFADYLERFGFGRDGG